jgi:pyruvate dehydrogenase E2 component (dihydrolipoamide acetyltransferase)
MASEAASQPTKKAEAQADSSPEPPKGSNESKLPQPEGQGDHQVKSPLPTLPKGERIYASPIAKKIALERGIPLSKVKGTGPDGRIVREDVEKYKPEAAAASATTSVPQPHSPLPDYEDIPVTNMRRTIGTRLTQSKQEVPHYYLTVDINMDKVLKLRQVFNKSLAEKEGGAKLSVNDFIVKAVSCALADVPEANSAWLGETIRM